MINGLVACDQREYMKRKFLAKPRALVKEIEKNLQLCYCNKSEIISRVWEVKNESEITTFRVKHDAVYQFEKLTSRLMDWVTTDIKLNKRDLVTTGDVKQNKGHSSSIESE